MRKIILIAPDLVGDSPEDSVLCEKQGDFEVLASRSELFQIEPFPQSETPELAYFGVDPTKHAMAQGPLTISALGVDPPERSVHFHLSLLSLDESETLALPKYRLPEPTLRELMESLCCLNTKVLTFVRGEEFDHGLVWERGSLDLRTTPAREAIGKAYRQCLPEGDGESLLRRFVDDSVNILSEHPVNKQRIEEGLPPLRILWPWGQGFRWPLPNFALRRGEMVWVESDSLRVAGLTRLLGYRHGTRYAYGRGLKLDFEALLKQLLTRSPVILLFDQFLKLRELRRFEDMRRFYVQLGTSLIRPLLEYAQEEPLELLFLSPSFSDAAREGEFSRGLGLYFQNLQPMTSTFPFDERVFEDKRVPRRVLWQEIEKVL